MPHFSVIMPVYNKYPYLQKAVESVLAQNYGDWELILVENGSTDGSGALADSFSDPRITILHQKHTGVSIARNRGVEQASAPWICFLDSDDWWEPSFLAEMDGLITRHPDAGLYSTSYYIAKHGRRRVAPTGIDETFAEGEIDYFAQYASSLCMPVCVGTVCLSKNIFDELGGFNPDLHIGEDFDLWIRIAIRHTVVILNKPLFTYNQDVVPKYRSTQQLHSPEHHFLWHCIYPDAPEKIKILLDRLTAYNLLPYYLSRRYHKDTMPLLQSVDWNNIPKTLRRPYQRPLWVERIKYLVTKALATVRNLVR